MSSRLRAAAVMILGGITIAEPLLACGEKFLMRSRGTRFQRAAPARAPASILVYLNPSLNLARALDHVPVDATLSKAGYRPTTVTSQAEFIGALGRGGWDLVVVNVADAGTLLQQAQNLDVQRVLPVAFRPTEAELAAARKQYRRVLKAPVKSQSFLDAIDDALAMQTATAKADVKQNR